VYLYGNSCIGNWKYHSTQTSWKVLTPLEIYFLNSFNCLNYFKVIIKENNLKKLYFHYLNWCYFFKLLNFWIIFIFQNRKFFREFYRVLRKMLDSTYSSVHSQSQTTYLEGPMPLFTFLRNYTANFSLIIIYILIIIFSTNLLLYTYLGWRVIDNLF